MCILPDINIVTPSFEGLILYGKLFSIHLFSIYLSL